MLIPLYAVGVFVPFTLSQSAMIIHWFRERQGWWVGKSFINLTGALISLALVDFFGFGFVTVLAALQQRLAILDHHAMLAVDVL